MDERRWARAMHDDRGGKLMRELPRRGKMIGMCMRVDEITEAQAMAGCQRVVAVNLAELRIDQRRRAGFLAAYQVGAASPAGNRLENHALPHVPISVCGVFLL